MCRVLSDKDISTAKQDGVQQFLQAAGKDVAAATVFSFCLGAGNARLRLASGICISCVHGGCEP